MSTARDPQPEVDANSAFFEKAETALRELFEMARARNELHFALSLAPEFRGCQGAGWSTAQEAHTAFEEYLEFLNDGALTPLKARVALAFYCHLSEASGFYEIPKNMLRVAEGERYNLWPFQRLVERHKVSGSIIAPNANKVLRDLAGHAKTLGLDALSEVFRDAFDSDVRNAYAHADYIIWDDGIRLRKRNGGNPRLVSWPEFHLHFHRGINFFHLLGQIVQEYTQSYDPPKQIRGQLADEPEGIWTIHSDPVRRAFSISG
ncbi:hypothetical protein [Lysobacter sp. TY2-98]|uniref:hypothetical protein n=1 Tax=Lysobacter sp. TY2-98 TaxID=2290922 RepID=UPI0013B375F2|nr:hypothetical protein [Lysobacter sp. TY2-98]